MADLETKASSLVGGDRAAIFFALRKAKADGMREVAEVVFNWKSSENSLSLYDTIRSSADQIERGEDG